MPHPKSPSQFRKDILKHTEDAVALAERILATLKVEEPEALHSVACLLFAGIVDGCRGIICLFRSGLHNSIPKILRPVIEMSVSLTNIGIDKDYYEFVILDSVINEKLNIDYAMKCDIVANDDMNFECANSKLESFVPYEKNLSSCKYKTLKNFERYKMADMLTAYNTLHRYYSSNIHGSIFSLEECYGGDSNDCLATLAKRIDDQWIATHIDVLSVCLSKSVGSIVSLCGYNAKRRVERFNRSIAICRKLADAK